MDEWILYYKNRQAENALQQLHSPRSEEQAMLIYIDYFYYSQSNYLELYWICESYEWKWCGQTQIIH